MKWTSLPATFKGVPAFSGRMNPIPAALTNISLTIYACIVCGIKTALFIHTVPLKHNVARARKQAFACARIITNKRGMAHERNTYHASFISGLNTCKQNVCHTPFISDYSCTSKYLLTSTHDIALERYHTKIAWTSLFFFLPQRIGLWVGIRCWSPW